MQAAFAGVGAGESLPQLPLHPRPHAKQTDCMTLPVLHLTSPAWYCRYCGGNYKPEMPAVEELEPGTVYLEQVDARYRRIYNRKPLAA